MSKRSVATTDLPSGDLPVTAARRRPSSRLLAAAGAALLCGAIAAVYGRALHAPFVFDDASSISTNDSITRLWPLLGTSEHRGPFNPPPDTAVSARPLVNGSFAVNYHFGALDPVGYRAVNIVLHMLAALLVWALVARTLRLEYFRGAFDSSAGCLGWCVALIWAMHPLVTEAVVYVTQRTELMMAVAYLATLYASLRYWSAQRPAARRAWLVAAVLACTLGALSKEVIATVPLVVLAFERTFLRGSFRQALAASRPLYVGLIVALLPLAVINAQGPRTPQAGFGLGVGAVAWWLTQIKVLALYLKLSVWPWPLVIHYEMPYLQTVGEAWPWVVGAVIVCVAVLWLFWRRTASGFLLFTALVILLPTLAVPLVREVAAERRMYLPLAALVTLAVVGGFALLRRLAAPLLVAAPARRPALVAVACACALAVGLGLLSVRRLSAFDDEVTLWQDALEHQPDNVMVRTNLGIFLGQRGEQQQAIEHLQHALQIEPRSVEAHYNLARALEEAGQPAEAIDHYERALRGQADHVAAHNNLGRLLAANGKSAQAVEHFRAALRLKPDFGPAHNNLGIELLAAGAAAEAIPHFEEGLRYVPSIEGYTNLATAYAMAGRRDEAIRAAQRGAQLARTQNQPELAERIETAIEAFRAQEQ
ncbi:MAG: tetratricopeptide repeat protein [Pirellulales bacterium]